ncbi:MAG TPA: hypothetical protein VHF92_00835 [Geodermatophilus sp.]|nr:hypothetical protein [Geodermatophilus sp.]
MADQQPDIWERVRQARDYAREMQAQADEAAAAPEQENESEEAGTQRWSGLFGAALYEAIGNTLDVILGEKPES